MQNILRRLPIGEPLKEEGAPRYLCSMLHGDKPETGSDEEKEWLKKLRNIEKALKARLEDTVGLKTSPDDIFEDELKPKGKRYYWWDNQKVKDLWLSDNNHLARGTNRLVAFTLLDQHLRQLMPPDTLTDLEPLISSAHRQLETGYTPAQRRYGQLDNKIDLFYQPLPMISEDIDPIIRENIFTAVLDSKAIEADYHSIYDNESWSGRLTLSLQKLVFKYNHLKIIAYNHDNGQVRELTASKLRNINILNLTNFVSATQEPALVQVILRTDSRYFYEGYFKSVLISTDQSIEPDSDGRHHIIKFTLPLNPKPDSDAPEYFDLVNQLSTWADQIEVIKPSALREEVQARIQKMVDRYSLKPE